jgi:hypothetical protein
LSHTMMHFSADKAEPLFALFSFIRIESDG